MPIASSLLFELVLSSSHALTSLAAYASVRDRVRFCCRWYLALVEERCHWYFQVNFELFDDERRALFESDDSGSGKHSRMSVQARRMSKVVTVSYVAVLSDSVVVEGDAASSSAPFP
jgi:hypothetical protein